ncbi:MAG TPA: permease, partial [Acidimicrobiales bacterium]
MATSSVLVDIGRSAREASFMFWETLWPIILGFGLSGAIQTFLSGRTIERQLGTHRPSAIARATGYGMASSSCSYAATAMAKSFFVKGADFVSVSVFMFASTNLVLELGVVLIALIGWQFAVSEFVGGLIMIALLATIGSFWLRGRSVTRAGELVGRREGSFASAGEPRARWQRARTRAGWADAASYTLSDLTMIRKELIIGYGVAGLLAVVVPHSWWHALFWPGHGIWTTIENVVVGPFIAIVSFVCSIGNVPLAAALWQGGVSFGGVISFIFADLVTFPILLIYRRYYGTQMMLRMLAVFWLCMSVAGLITEELFRAS